MKKRPLLGAALACALVFAGPTGCLLGCPVAAISGEPWGMTRDDLSALGGKKRGPIFGGSPVLAAIDLPFSLVLDTGLLPLSGLIWLIRMGVGGDDGDHGHAHGEDGHTHDDGEDADHSHDAEKDPPADDDVPGPWPEDGDGHPHDDGTAHPHGADTHTHEQTADPIVPGPKTRGHHHNDFVFRHHHGDGNFEHVHAARHHHGDGNLEHDHGNGNVDHVHLSSHHHGDHDLDHHHGDGVFDHSHPLDDPSVLDPGKSR